MTRTNILSINRALGVGVGHIRRFAREACADPECGRIASQKIELRFADLTVCIFVCDSHQAEILEKIALESILQDTAEGRRTLHVAPRLPLTTTLRDLHDQAEMLAGQLDALVQRGQAHNIEVALETSAERCRTVRDTLAALIIFVEQARRAKENGR